MRSNHPEPAQSLAVPALSKVWHVMELLKSIALLVYSQDLMVHAVHASSTAMATALQQATLFPPRRFWTDTDSIAPVPQVLAYTHEQKRQRGVDEMLLRLYEPILW